MHTDEVCEVIKTMAAGSLTLVMVGLNFFWSYLNQTLTKLHVFQIMDSMDWFDPNGPEAAQQARIIKRGLKTGGPSFSALRCHGSMVYCRVRESGVRSPTGGPSNTRHLH